MADQGKLEVSRSSVDAFIKSLGTSDNFEVMTFNVSPTLLFSKLAPADEAAKAKAVEFIAAQQARGGTVLRPAIETAYKYATGAADGQPLNVVILSDGMSETGERTELLGLIARKPAGVKVFCIGVGNDVNRPLLTQMAEDAGGLAAFISQGDDFERQAKAFRRKLTHPVAANIKLDFGGGSVYDLEPAILPDLYHGAPVRVYGRYKQSGPVKVTLKATVLDKPIETTVELKFPGGDDENPEIERMWAWHKVQRLLGAADRTGSRDAAVNEVVRLGEAYSIATEYTSFLVLENDAEYQRWQIERKNALRVERDRRKQEALRADLEKLNEKTLAALGPVPAAGTDQKAAEKKVADNTAERRTGATPVRTMPAKGGLPEVIYEGVPDDVPLARPATQAATQPARMPATQRPVEIPTRASRGADINLPHRSGGGALDPVTGGIALGLAALALAGRKRRK
jgi:Ca-activated chloride channel family protein